MALDPRTPVVVGVGAVTQPGDDPEPALDAFELMVQATELAGADCGVPAALARIDLVLVPKGIWTYRDPGRAVAARFGSSDAASRVGEVGVLQQTLLTRAAQAVADGGADVVLVCGAEAKYRDVLAKRSGVDRVDPDPSVGDPDEVLRPVGDIVTATEIARDFVLPTTQYAAIESAIAHAEGRTPPEQRDHAARLWAAFGQVAAGNELAWDRRGLSAAAIATPGPANRMVAMPYTKLLCSQWNVNQSAALLVMAAGTATALGVPRDRWVFQLVAAESNQMVPLPCRGVLDRWPAFEAVADALGLTGDGAAVPSIVDLYSCFPAAVQVQARALGLPLDGTLSQSGGMTFGGGPLNHAVLQALVPMVQRMRAEPEAIGLITSVSGMLTKSGGSIWSGRPPESGFRAIDVTADSVARTPVLPLVPDAVGPGTVVVHTVLYANDEPDRAVAVLDVEGGRTVACCVDDDVATAMTESDWVGRLVRVVAPGEFVVA